MSWYEYPEYYCENCERIAPTEANEIEEEAIDKFRDYLHKQFSEEFCSIDRRRKAQDETDRLLKDKQKNLDERERKIKELESSLNKERENIRKEETKRVGEMFFGRFTPGNKVWFYIIDKNEETCPLCDGKRTIKHTLIDKNGVDRVINIVCPVCEYGKIISGYTYNVYQGEIKRSKLAIVMDGDKVSIPTSDFDNEVSWVEITYMNYL